MRSTLFIELIRISLSACHKERYKRREGVLILRLLNKCNILYKADMSMAIFYLIQATGMLS